MLLHMHTQSGSCIHACVHAHATGAHAHSHAVMLMLGLMLSCPCPCPCPLMPMLCAFRSTSHAGMHTRQSCVSCSQSYHAVKLIHILSPRPCPCPCSCSYSLVRMGLHMQSCSCWCPCNHAHEPCTCPRTCSWAQPQTILCCIYGTSTDPLP